MLPAEVAPSSHGTGLFLRSAAASRPAQRNGSDAFYQRIVFPLRQGEHVVNLYGRSIGAAFAHRFLPGTKGGLYAWEKVRHCPEVILVEGLFDYAALRQAGFHNVTCSLGTHLNAASSASCANGPRTVYLTFDVDANQSGQQAAEQLAHRLDAKGIAARRVLLPQGHDPNSFFVQGGDAHSSSLFWRPLSHEVPRDLVRKLHRAHTARIKWSSNTGRGVGWINRYLDREYVRRLADKSLRIYAQPAALRALVGEHSSHRRYLLGGPYRIDPARLSAVPVQPATAKPSAATINDRVADADRAIRNEFPTLPAKSLTGFNRLSCSASLWALAVRAWR
jgi:DNA primase